MSYFGRARSISARSHSIPNFSTFSHCAAVSRIERCSSLVSGGAGGLPRGRFSGSMGNIVTYLMGHNKCLAYADLLNHNKDINFTRETCMTFAIFQSDTTRQVDVGNRTYTVWFDDTGAPSSVQVHTMSAPGNYCVALRRIPMSCAPAVAAIKKATGSQS